MPYRPLPVSRRSVHGVVTVLRSEAAVRALPRTPFTWNPIHPHPPLDYRADVGVRYRESKQAHSESRFTSTAGP
jgi:hypothetical protein